MKACRNGFKEEMDGSEYGFKWPAKYDTLMKDVAMEVISQIERHREDAGESEACYMVHLFSNIGVFLWDQIQHLAFDDG
jgi:hypothetical protein